MNSKQQDTMTSQEVADMLGVELGYLYFLNRTNQLSPIPQRTIQKKPRLKYRRSDVQAFMEKREQEAKEEDSRHLQPAS